MSKITDFLKSVMAFNVAQFSKDASGNVLLSTNGAQTLASRSGAPKIVFLGDSLTGYSNATSPSASSLVDNGDGTATVTFTLSQGILAGDTFGIQGALDGAFDVPPTTPCISVSGSGPYSYTYALNAKPSVSPDLSSAITMMFGDQYSGYSFVGHFRSLTGHKFKCINAGIGGDSSAQMLARFDRDVTIHNPDVVVLCGFRNDPYKGFTLAQTKANMALLLAKCRAIGAQLWILTMPPQPSTFGAWTTAIRDLIIQQRRYLVNFAQDNRLPCLDWATLGAGTTQMQDPTSTNAVPSTGMINATDLVHATNAAGYIAAKGLAAIANAAFPSAQPALARNVTDGGAFTNPTFTGTGGTATNGTGTVTGVIATNCTVQVLAGTGVATCSQVARTIANDGDNAGNWQRVSFAAAAANDQFCIKLQDVHSAFTNGDLVRFQVAARLVSGANCREISHKTTVQCATTGNKVYTDQAVTAAQSYAYPEPWGGTIGQDMPVRSPNATHGNITVLQPQIIFTANAAGTFVVDVACASIEKVN